MCSRLSRNVVAVVLVALSTGACSDSTEGVFGAELYQQSCQRCHGAAGEGGIGGPIDARSDAAQLDDEQLADIIHVGPGTMPSFPTFTDEQIASLVEHMRELQEGE